MPAETAAIVTGIGNGERAVEVGGDQVAVKAFAARHLEHLGREVEAIDEGKAVDLQTCRHLSGAAAEVDDGGIAGGKVRGKEVGDAVGAGHLERIEDIGVVVRRPVAIKRTGLLAARQSTRPRQHVGRGGAALAAIG